MAVSKQVADAYKTHFGIDVIGDTVEQTTPASGATSLTISPQKVGADALQTTKKEQPTLEVPSFSKLKKQAFAPSGSIEYVPQQGVGYDYTQQSKLLTDEQLKTKLAESYYTNTGAYATGTGSQEFKALSAEQEYRDSERKKIADQNDMLQRKLNFQDRQRQLGVSALDEAASRVGTDKLTDITGTNYLNPLFYAAKFADLHITAAKSFAQGTLDAASALGASIDLNAGDNVVGDFGQAVSDYAKIIKQKYPQLNPSKNIGSWEDPEFYVKGISGMIPNLLGGMMAAEVGAAAGAATTANPAGAAVGAIAGATSFGYAMESGSIYDDLLTRGYSPSSASIGARAYGAIAALPEGLFHLRGVGDAVMHPLMQEVLKKGAQAEIKQTLFTGAKNLAKKGAGAVVEGTTEAMQQLAQNAITKFYDKNQGLFDGMAESFVFGLGSGGIIEAGQHIAGKDVKKEAVIALQNERAIESAVNATEALAKVYPKDRDIKVLLDKTKQALKDARIQTEVVNSKFVQENTATVVRNNVLDASVAKNISGKFIATFDATVDGQSVTFTTSIPATTEQDAQLETAKKTQQWLEKQVSAGNITNIEEAKVLNTSLKEIISPKQDVVTEEVQNTIEDIKKNTSETNDKIDALIAEAKKYKNADEFDSELVRNGRDISKELKNIYPDRSYIDALGELVKGRIPKKPIDYTSGIKVYHGTDNTFKEIDPSKSNSSSKTGVGEGHVFYTTDREIAGSYGKNILESTLQPKNPLVVDAGSLDWRDIKFEGKSYTINELATIAEKRGYGSLIVENVRDTGGKQVGDQPAGFKSATTIAIFNKQQNENIKTVSEKTTPTTGVKNEKKIKENKQFVSRVSERMAEEFGTEKIMADKININEESKKAVDLVLKDKDKAYRVAMGIDDVSSTEQTFVNNALYMRAVEEGNFDLANKLIKKGSMVVTDAAQTLNAAKASVSDNSARKYLQELMLTRFLMVNEKYTADIQDKQEKTSPTQRVKKQIKKDVESVRKYISEKKKLDITQAQDFISSLQCK